METDLLELAFVESAESDHALVVDRFNDATTFDANPSEGAAPAALIELGPVGCTPDCAAGADRSQTVALAQRRQAHWLGASI